MSVLQHAEPGPSPPGLSELDQSGPGHAEEVRRSIAAGAALTPPFLLMNGLAATVASCGLLENSAAVIIGAMIIALLMGPITGIGLALVDADTTLLRRSLIAEGAGAVLVLAIGLTAGVLSREMPLGSEVIGRTAPNILDLFIALAGGAAGAYTTISPRLSAGLVGVAIATALVPPLCSCGLCLAHGLYREGGGAFLLFATNLIAIQSAASLVFWLCGFHRMALTDRKSVARAFLPSAALLLVLAALLGRSFQTTLAREALRSQAQTLLRADLGRGGAASLSDLSLHDGGGRTTLTAEVSAPWIITPASCARLQAEVRAKTGRTNIDLRIRSVLTRECDAKRFLWHTPSAPPSGLTEH